MQRMIACLAIAAVAIARSDVEESVVRIADEHRAALQQRLP